MSYCNGPALLAFQDYLLNANSLPGHSGVFAIGIALANPSQTVDAQIAVSMHDYLGNPIPLTITDSQGRYSPTAVTSFTLKKHSHQGFNAKPLNAAGEVKGVILFSSNVPVFALGIRGVNNQAFTSIRALGQ